MRILICSIALLTLVIGAAGAAEPDGDAIDEYEARLEEISRELLGARRELEALVEDVVHGETGRVLVFLENPPPAWRESGVQAVVDGRTVFSRPFTPAEADVLARGLPLELVDLRLPAGEHRVAVSALGEEPLPPGTLPVSRGEMVSWVATGIEGRLEWRIE